MAKISVIGSGGWGIALTILLHKNGHNLTIWSFDKKEVEELKATRENKTKLPNISLPDDIEVTDDLKEAVSDKDILVLAVPSKAIRSVSKSLKDIIKDNQIIVNVAKGLEEDTLKTMTDIIEEELKEKNPQVAVLSGPSHAEEVGKGIPTTCVVSAHNKELTLYLQNIFMNPSFRVYTSPDMIGVEIGGALKNVIALAAGIADGLNYGDNTKAALITRGIKEISSLGVAMGGEQSTFYGLTGLGDLIVKNGHCYGIILENMFDFLKENLLRVNSSPVEIIEIDESEIPQNEYQELNITLASLRLDSLVAELTNLSRTLGTNYIDLGNVQLNYEVEREKSTKIAVGDTIIIKKYGKFKIVEENGLTKKDKIKLIIRKYM